MCLLMYTQYDDDDAYTHKRSNNQLSNFKQSILGYTVVEIL